MGVTHLCVLLARKTTRHGSSRHQTSSGVLREIPEPPVMPQPCPTTLLMTKTSSRSLWVTPFPCCAHRWGSLGRFLSPLALQELSQLFRRSQAVSEEQHHLSGSTEEGEERNRDLVR